MQASQNSPVQLNWDIDGKVAIVTGANTGIGKCTAFDLARMGARVVLACRNVEAAEATCQEIREQLGMFEKEGEIMVTWRHLDLSSLESIQKFANDFMERENELHLLVNNAGLLPPDDRRKTNDGRFELTFATNHLGPFYLTKLLLPLLRKTAPSRIVNVSSVGYKMCKKVGGYRIEDAQYDEKPEEYEPWMAYCQTKLANILTTRQLNRNLQGSQISVYSCHPGMVKTDIFRHRSMKFSIFCGPIVALFGRTPSRGALAVIHCSTAPDIESNSGCYFVDTKIEDLESFAVDDEMGKKLWKLSEDLIGKYCEK